MPKGIECELDIAVFVAGLIFNDPWQNLGHHANTRMYFVFDTFMPISYSKLAYSSSEANLGSQDPPKIVSDLLVIFHGIAFLA